MRVVKPLVFAAMCAPLGLLVFRAFSGGLGANPIDRITDDTGTMALRSLVLTLAVTPVRRISGWNDVIKLRRMLGLFAFTYAALHFLTYIVLDQFFDWQTISGDLTKRPYIIAGFTGFVLMLPLAIPSNGPAPIP